MGRNSQEEMGQASELDLEEDDGCSLGRFGLFHDMVHKLLPGDLGISPGEPHLLLHGFSMFDVQYGNAGISCALVCRGAGYRGTLGNETSKGHTTHGSSRLLDSLAVLFCVLA